jgi:thymidine phosphorylase
MIFLKTHTSLLPRAPIIRPVTAQGEGTVSHIDTRALGIAVIELGGGRRVASDSIDHAVGLTGLGRASGQRPVAITRWASFTPAMKPPSRALKPWCAKPIA